VNVAIVAGYYPPDVKGGGEISTQLLAEMLTAAGCAVHVLTCGNEERAELVNGIAVQRIASPNLYWDFRTRPTRMKRLGWHLLDNENPRARRRVRDFLARTNADIAITSTIENFGGGAWSAAADAGVPCVHVLRSYYPFCYRGNAVRGGTNCDGACLDCAALSFGRRRASQRVNGIVGISRYVLQRHLDQGLFGAAATTVIGEPIDAALFRSPREAASPRRFGYLGVLSADKGLETLAAAWKHSRSPGSTLTIAGRGKPDYVATIERAFGSDVTFCGWVESSAYLASIDVLVVPSVWNEPFGRIVIEAFASGVPVIGSRIGGIAETIGDGRNGALFPPGDAQALAALIDRFAAMTGEVYHALSSDARAEAEHYESRVIAAAHVRFYESVIAATRGRAVMPR
jgi:glycosyltransferase involved in cell wall biosynthesis